MEIKEVIEMTILEEVEVGLEKGNTWIILIEVKEEIIG